MLAEQDTDLLLAVGLTEMPHKSALARIGASTVAMSDDRLRELGTGGF